MSTLGIGMQSVETLATAQNGRNQNALRIATFAFVVGRVLKELEAKHGISTANLTEIGRECVVEWCRSRRVSRRSFNQQIGALEVSSSASQSRH
jgi:hypothetical protein